MSRTWISSAFPAFKMHLSLRGGTGHGTAHHDSKTNSTSVKSGTGHTGNSTSPKGKSGKGHGDGVKH